MSSPRSPVLLPLLAVLVLAGGVAFWAIDVRAGDAGLPVFDVPEDSGGAAPSVIAAGDAPDGATGAHVILTLQRLARPIPPRPQPPRVLLVRDAADRGIAGSYVAGPAASPLARTFRGLQIVRFDLAGAPVHYRAVRLRSETEDLVIERGADVRARGKVVDHRGQALAGARVWLAGVSGTTGADGRFDLPPVPVGPGMPLVVRAAGQASHFAVLDAAGCADLGQRPVALGEGTALRVRVLGLGGAAPSSWLSVLPVGGRDSRLLAYPFFMAAIEADPLPADGIATLDGLPRGAGVRVAVHHPVLVTTLSEEVRLAGPRADLVVHVQPREPVHGRVVDEAGAPLPGAALSARPGGTGLTMRDTGWVLPAAAYVRDAAVTRSAADGSFSLPVPRDEEGLGLLTAEATGHVGIELPLPGGEGPAGPLVLVPEGATGAPALLLVPGADVPGVMKVTVRDGADERGPYPWPTEREFEVRLGKPGLYRVGVRVDAGQETVREVMVRGPTQVSVTR